MSTQGVYAVEELESLLARHDKDVRYYEENVAAIYDKEMGHPTITTLIQDHHIHGLNEGIAGARIADVTVWLQAWDHDMMTEWTQK